jgi:hypothetical protein
MRSLHVPPTPSIPRGGYDPRGARAAIWHRFDGAGPGERAELAQELVNRVAIEAYDSRRANPAWGPVPVRPLAGLAGAALLMRVKDEDDILPQNLRHHHRMGFRRFFILDNGSTDGTAEAIAAFRAEAQDSLVFSAIDPIVANRPGEKLNALAAFAQVYLSAEARPAEWLFFLDADEFLTPYGVDGGEQAAERLEAVLADPRALLLTFHWVQCASAEVLEVLAAGSEPLEAMPVRWPVLKVAVPKVAFRAGHGLRVIAGNHNVVEFPFTLERSVGMAQTGWFMHHYATRSMEQVRRKVMKARRALAALEPSGSAQGAQVSAHWRALIAGYEAAGDAAIRQSIEWHIRDCGTGR